MSAAAAEVEAAGQLAPPPVPLFFSAPFTCIYCLSLRFDPRFPLRTLTIVYIAKPAKSLPPIFIGYPPPLP